MHLLYIFVFCFSCLDFFAFQFFLRWCVLISPLCLLVFAVEIHIPALLNCSDKENRKSFAEITAEKLCKHQLYTSGIYICVGKDLLFERS
jgi:hypothetical protein